MANNTGTGFIKINSQELEKWLTENNLTRIEVSEAMGFDKSYVSACMRRGTMQKTGHRLLCLTYKLPDDSFIFQEPKKEETVIVETKPTEVDLTPILEKLDELIGAINKLGNIEMQNLEYNKAIMNDVSSSNSEIKKLNDKWNKPSAYRK